ncbi:MAG: hypothetical protein A2Y77_10480 [Planctomycetes bacterium RBG_13_62_9]|nr:MAG: hypothetical protein A2Y77_10480 [Planctomycetes bacterium RBG_13_62_9]
MAPNTNPDDRRTLQEAQIGRALGVFLLFFAGIVLVSILFTDTGIGRLTNLGAGAVIGMIGAIMLVKGLKADRKRPPA